MTISVHLCVRGRTSVHLPVEWRFAVHSCVRGKIPVHLLEGWWSRCIHVWGVGYRCIYLRSDDLRCIHVWEVGYRCIYLRSDDLRCIHVWGVGNRCIYLRNDDFGAFICEWYDSGAFTWGMMISMHSCVRGRISVHLPEEWRFWCIHEWGVRFRCIYLRDDDVGAFMRED